MLPIIRPDVRFDEVEDDLRAILASGVLTSGPIVERFEHAVAAYCGVRHAVATTSATTALHLSLAALGVGPGDEVLVSDFTFPATGNVVLQAGATPVLIDSSPDSFGIDVDAARAAVTDRTKAIIPVDPFGQPCDLPAVNSLAADHGLAVVEDAACALGAAIDGRLCGSWPATGCFSFHPRKVVTTGEGGMVTTDDDDLATRLRSLRSHGGVRSDVGMSFVAHGFNYRLSEIPAALGVAQMARIAEILADRSSTAARYDEALRGVAGVAVPDTPAAHTWTHQSYVVMIDSSVSRDGVVGFLREAGIEATLGTYAMHAHPAFSHLGYESGQLPNSWRYQCQSLTLPLIPGMPHSDIERVVSALEKAVDACPA